MDGVFLIEIGRRLRKQRRRLSLTQGQLSEETGISKRFLVQLEAGEGNISVQKLMTLCHRLCLPMEILFKGLGPAKPRHIALVGLRGAGKSTVGALLADELQRTFLELDEEIEKEAGLSLGEIFELRGESHYRELEASVLTRCLSQETPLVIATGGSIVTSPNTWMSLRTSAQTVWLRASPHAHLARVRAQGDLRPMRGRPDALGELKAILKERESLYGMCEQHIDTDTLNALETVAQLVATQ